MLPREEYNRGVIHKAASAAALVAYASNDFSLLAACRSERVVELQKGQGAAHQGTSQTVGTPAGPSAEIK